VCSVKFGELCGKNSNGAQMVTFFTKAEAIWKNKSNLTMCKEKNLIHFQIVSFSSRL
jgi:hypothetical protein